MATTLKPVYLIYGDEFQVDQALRRLKQRIAAEAGGGDKGAAGGTAAATGNDAPNGANQSNAAAAATGNDAPNGANQSNAAAAATGNDAPNGANQSNAAATSTATASDIDARLDVREFDAGLNAGKGAKPGGAKGSQGAGAGAKRGGNNVAVQAVQAAGTLPFFAVTNLVVVRNVDKLKADDQRVLADYAANASPATVLVLTAGKMAKSAVLFKAVDRAGQTYEYATPKGPDLIKWVTGEFKEQGKTIDVSTARTLINMVGTDQATLASEILKISAYAGAEVAVDVHAVEAVAVRNPESSIFSMVDALGHRRPAEALAELSKLLNAGEPAQRILYMIVRQYRILLKTKALENTKANAGAAAKIMGVAPFLVDKYKAQARRYSEAELRRVYTLLKDTDIAMKTGRQEPNLALEMLVGRITTS